ncbi:response regulator [Kineococcus sp. SYSU DK004]|uniref:response regulator n=1 Tax=Kineococcus sp. SYSU DK004 TaxID=3383125 RepID=UPI003D7EDC22
MVSVVLADDQELVRTGLRALLEVRGVDVVAEAADGVEALEAVAATDPDVVLLDLRMPRLDGIRATRRLVERGARARVLVLTTYDLDEYVYAALRAGAAGFLLKTCPADRLADGVRVVAAGEALLAPVLTRRLIEAHVQRPPPTPDPPALRVLTAREREVLTLVAHGLTNGEIASALSLSEATVKTHVNRVLAKTGVRHRAHAVVLAYETGLVVPGARGG